MRLSNTFAAMFCLFAGEISIAAASSSSSSTSNKIVPSLVASLLLSSATTATAISPDKENDPEHSSKLLRRRKEMAIERNMQSEVTVVTEVTAVTAETAETGNSDDDGEDSIFDILSNSTGNFTFLADLIDAAELTEVFSEEGNFTLFAPDDAAFEELPEDMLTKLMDEEYLPQLQDLLLFHALDSVELLANLTDDMMVMTLNGQNITINLDPARINEDVENATIIEEASDMEAFNGIVHAIDTVLAPESMNSTIVDILLARNDTFATLVEALNATELLELFAGEGPFTIFAPTDEAFDALPDGFLEELLEDPDALEDFLKYHVIEENAPSSSLSSGEVEALNEDLLEIVVDEGNITVNDANVTMPDIIASNGIVHGIDAVLIPPEGMPTMFPTTFIPTFFPTTIPTMFPTTMPTMFPTTMPTEKSSKSRKSGKTKASKGTKGAKGTKTGGKTAKAKAFKDGPSSSLSMMSELPLGMEEKLSDRREKNGASGAKHHDDPRMAPFH